jgi:hypothetical protein
MAAVQVRRGRVHAFIEAIQDEGAGGAGAAKAAGAGTAGGCGGCGSKERVTGVPVLTCTSLSRCDRIPSASLHPCEITNRLSSSRISDSEKVQIWKRPSARFIKSKWKTCIKLIWGSTFGFAPKLVARNATLRESAISRQTRFRHEDLESERGCVAESSGRGWGG